MERASFAIGMTMQPPAPSTTCPCCASEDLWPDHTLVSPFLAGRAWGGDAEPTTLLYCRGCDFRFYRRTLTEQEMAAYYAGYRDEAYFLERHRHEPFYTRARHAAICRIGDERRRALMAALAGANRVDVRSVLDFGGGSGALIADLPAPRKAVYDPSGSPVLPGIQVFTDLARLEADWELVVCAQVLEHISDPGGMLRQLGACLAEGGLIYLEVPDQNWRPLPPRPTEGFLRFLIRHDRALKLADFISTALRVTFGLLPPFGFVPMREHVNFFSLQALEMLARRHGFVVATSGRHANGSLYLTAHRS
jgi:SAM-dependent methyltransferase